MSKKPLKKTKRIKDTTKPKKSLKTQNKASVSPSTSKLRKDLWKLFSGFIRNRDNYTCFTCGRKAEGSGMHAGHFITGATCPTELYFDETNVHAQCYHCNINLSGNWVAYEKNMILKYGKKKVEALKKARFLLRDKKDWQWYEQKIKEYKALDL